MQDTQPTPLSLLEERLMTLERSNVTLRRSAKVFGVLTLGLCCLLLVGAARAQQDADAVEDLIRAKRIEVVDQEGAPQITMFVDDAGARLDVLASDRIVIDDDVGTVGAINVLSSNTGQSIVVIGKRAQWGTVKTFLQDAQHPEDKPLVDIAVMQAGSPDTVGASLFVSQPETNGRCQLFANPVSGHGEMTVFNADGVEFFGSGVPK